MTGDFITKEDCRSCRFCCQFRRKSLWEVPKLPEYFVDKYRTSTKGGPIRYRHMKTDDGSWVITDLSDLFATDDPEEEAPCPFLDDEKGCILPPEDKPFECDAWPLRYMRLKDDTVKVTLTPTCPAPGLKDIEALKDMSRKRWEKELSDYAGEHPYIINDYRDGYIILD